MGCYRSLAELLNLNLLWFKWFAYSGSVVCACMRLCMCVCMCVWIFIHVHIYTLTCSPRCMCELWVGLERRNPCVMSCEPPSPFLHSYCLRPSYSSKKQKGRYCIRYWLWDGIILCSTIYIGHDALYAAICWRQPAVPSLCVIRGHPVLSFNTLDYAHIKKVHETTMHTHLEEQTHCPRWLIRLFLIPIYSLGEKLI